MVQTSPSPPRPGPRRRGPRPGPRADRRLEILRQAAEVFRRKGYHGAGMREIAEGLGLRPGALYHYFAGKDDLLFAVQDEALARLTEGARAIARSRRPAPERLRDLLGWHLACTLAELGGGLAHVEVRELPPGPWQEVVRRRDAYERIVRRVVRDGVKAGAFRAVDPRLAAWWILGGLNWTAVWWRPTGRRSAADLAAAFSDLVLSGLAARPATPEEER